MMVIVFSFVCENENEAIVKYLIEHGVDVKKPNLLGITSLFVACRCGNKTIVKY